MSYLHASIVVIYCIMWLTRTSRKKLNRFFQDLEFSVVYLYLEEKLCTCIIIILLS